MTLPFWCSLSLKTLPSEAPALPAPPPPQEKTYLPLSIMEREAHSRPQSYAAFFKITSLVALVTAKNLFFLIGRFILYAQ